MSLFSKKDVEGYFNTQYYDALDLEARDHGTQLLEKKEQEIAQREQMKVGSGTSSKMVYIILGLAALGLLSLAILKKKGIL